MPNHIHLFAAPGDLDISSKKWIQYRKSQFTKRHNDPKHKWQSHHWDTRLRNIQHYDRKWEYVRNNPVRHGYVTHAYQWKYQGVIYQLEI